MENQELIQKASQGNMAPLLAKLRSGVPTSAGTGNVVGNDGGVDDTIWFDVLAAHAEGKLTDAQMDRCEDAIGAR